jgi:hypothetical protein
LKYTSVQRSRECKFEWAKKKRERRKNRNEHIKNIIEELSDCNSRDGNLKVFMEYAKKKLEHLNKLHEYYNKVFFRKLRWKSRIQTQRTEEKFFKKITETFGKKVLLCYGHWNRRSQMPGLIPSPTVGIRKKLQDRFLSVDVPEWNTTVTCNECNARTAGMKRQKKEGSDEIVSIHGLRYCNTCKTFLNRDKNAAKNILNNFLYFEKHGTWNPLFMPRRKNRNCNKSAKRKRKEETKEKVSKKKTTHNRRTREDVKFLFGEDVECLFGKGKLEKNL